MTYTKQNWADGDLITAAKLNHIEEGLASAGAGNGSVFYVETTGPLGIDVVATLNTTWQAVYDAMTDGKRVLARFIDDDAPEIIVYPINYVGFDDDVYCIGVHTKDTVNNDREWVYYCSDTPDGALRRG